MFTKKINENVIYIITFFIISFFLLSPLFHSNFYDSHDGEAHVARFAAYYTAFGDGQLIPRWAGNLNSGYGSPLFIFFYPLPGYIASLLHIFQLDFETVYKAVIFFCFTLSPVFFFIWLKRSANNEVAFVASLAYLLLPYRFLDLFVRGDIAELMSFVFIPLVFLFIDKAQKDKRITSVLAGSIFYAGLIVSHNAIAVIFSPIFVAYSYIFFRKMKMILPTLGILSIGLMLSAFFWIPAIVETKYVYSNLLVANIYKDNFVPLLHLFYSNWGFGPDVNKLGGLSPQIGILYSCVALLSFLLLFIAKEKRDIAFWFVIFITAVFMTTNYSHLLWGRLPLIRLMGYPWRFTSLSGFAACMLIFHTIKYINKNYLFLVILTFFIFTVPFVKVKTYVAKKPDNFYFAYQGTTDYHMRTMSKWVAGDFWKKAERQVELISGKGEIKELVKKSNVHEYRTKSTTPIRILDNTVYFPGWRVEVDGKKVPIEFQDQKHRGLITFQVPPGEHTINVIFGESLIRLIADSISLMGVITISAMFLLYRKKKQSIV